MSTPWGMMFELHSCGYITPLVGDFVAAGMDILQPLQTNNDLRYIKDNYGKDLILRLAIFDKQMDAPGYDRGRSPGPDSGVVSHPGPRAATSWRIWFPSRTGSTKFRPKSRLSSRKNSITCKFL